MSASSAAEACKLMAYVQASRYCIGAVHASYPLDAPFHGVDAASKKERDEAKLLHNGIWEFAYDGFDQDQADLLQARLCDVLEAARRLASESDATVLLQIGKGSSCQAWVDVFVRPILEKPEMSRVKLVNVEGKTLRVQNYAELPAENFVFVHVGLYARVGANALDVKPGTLLIPHSECYVGYDMCKHYRTSWTKDQPLTCTVQNLDEMMRGEWENEQEVAISGRSACSTPNLTSQLQHLCHPRLVLFGNADNSPWLTTEHYSAEEYEKLISRWLDMQTAERSPDFATRRCCIA
eukprot:TRINITY_DN7623_c0_g1_i1.p1 TRINITY_DN7623_c0_g1~~TRINITY_DN7623_c0_g1_i1.p1  ORF type:complete len:294 (+),score=62.22 TRINITY_DN7623_c0_g1_i1:54-935(+)